MWMRSQITGENPARALGATLGGVPRQVQIDTLIAYLHTL
jgi:hypothetical protein